MYEKLYFFELCILSLQCLCQIYLNFSKVFFCLFSRDSTLQKREPPHPTPHIGRLETERLQSGGPYWLLNWGKWGIKEYTNGRSPSWVGSLGSSCWYKKFLSCLGCSIVGPIQNIFFLTVHYFKSFVPIAQQAGQAVVSGRLSLNVCLWLDIKNKIPLVSSIRLCVFVSWCKLECCGNMKRTQRQPALYSSSVILDTLKATEQLLWEI